MRGLILAFGIAALLAAPALADTPEGVTLAIRIAPAVRLPAKGQVAVPVKLTLTNTTGRDVVLHGTNRCAVKSWDIDDSHGQSLGYATMCPMIYQPQERQLAAGKTYREAASLMLDGDKFRAGETYTLRYRFWEVPGTAKFMVK
jgi:hypothetical protein